MNFKEIIRITFNLVVIYAVGGALLAWLYAQTSPVIYNNMEEDKANALKGMMPVHLIANVTGNADAVKAVLPEGAKVEEKDGVLDVEVDLYKKGKEKLIKKMKSAGAAVTESSDYKTVEKGEWEPVHKKKAKYFEVQDKDGQVAAYIVESYHKGYSGAPGIFVAIDKDLTVRKVEILTHSETPGLGDEIENPVFKNQFKGKALGQLEVVKGEAGDKILAITGATISSRSITYGTRDAVQLITDLTSGAAAPMTGMSHEAAPAAEEGKDGH